MQRGFNKKLLWVIVVWFAILQAFMPFIHAHVQADTTAYGHGLHMHEADLFQPLDTVHTLKNVNDVQVVGVDKALVKTKNLEALPVPLFLMLFIIPLLAISIRRYKYAFVAHISIPPFLQSVAGQRAPPYF
ncbi:hypothetical protein [Methylotenera mobilis]|uniref:Uncharacterized protein n=1 Tax=Methylotenera mobilis (strain JLW8 / ATCC BAA-1282 / DSM 17540) TaxID=583345 RepID=C6WXM0_METML|nr:hypothetical protein [Methylotenera mobilis]ACT48669.1 hypothetical protein Mmol_1765 [Methylotenera mobilis JLW8]